MLHRCPKPTQRRAGPRSASSETPLGRASGRARGIRRRPALGDTPIDAGSRTLRESGRPEEPVELRHLRYFVAVAEELHFRRAAERLHVAQPAVSEQVRKLEDDLGVRLFDRTQRSVALTDAGAALLTQAYRVLRQAEAARVAARSAGARPGVRIGYVPTALRASIPRTLRRLVATMPNLQTTIEPGSGLDLVDAVRAGELDVAVVPLPVPTAGVRVTPLGEQRAVAVFPVDHEHAVK